MATHSDESQIKRHELYISIWSKAVDTQMHFNEMSVKSRQLGLTFVAAALGVSVVLLSKHEDFSFPEFDIFGWPVRIHVSVVLILAALYAVSHLDLKVYHRMLRGAVIFGEDFEENYMKEIFSLDKGMTQSISHFSRHDDAGYKKDNGRYIYTGNSKITAETKIRSFYKWTMGFLFVSALLLFIVNNMAHWMNSGGDISNVSDQSPTTTFQIENNFPHRHVPGQVNERTLRDLFGGPCSGC